MIETRVCLGCKQKASSERGGVYSFIFRGVSGYWHEICLRRAMKQPEKKK